MLIRTLVGCYYNKITTVCACKPTHTFSYAHTHAHARSRTHIFSSVGLHFLIRTHKRARLRTHAHIILVSTFSHPYTQVHARTIAHTQGTGTRDPPMDPLGPLSQTTLNARARV